MWLHMVQCVMHDVHHHKLLRLGRCR
jgi:hypothetical protein